MEYELHLYKGAFNLFMYFLQKELSFLSYKFYKLKNRINCIKKMLSKLSVNSKLEDFYLLKQFENGVTTYYNDLRLDTEYVEYWKIYVKYGLQCRRIKIEQELRVNNVVKLHNKYYVVGTIA